MSRTDGLADVVCHITRGADVEVQTRAESLARKIASHVMAQTSRWLMAVMLLGWTSSAIAQGRAPLPFQKDVTVFVGHTASFTRPTIGGAFGGGGAIVRFEVEIAATPGAGTPTRPSGGCICLNVLVQSWRQFDGMQFYGIGGFGLFGETMGGGGGSGELIAKHIGVGAKKTLVGGLRFRVDYRVFVLGDAPDATPGIVLQRHPQRVVVGLNYVF